MIIAATGHRSEDCGADEDTVRARLRAGLSRAVAWEEHVFICGMANGVDLWAGNEAIDLGYEIWEAKPWAGHQARRDDRALYARVIENATRVVNVVEQINYPGAWAYQKRNEWMVDNATHVLAYFNPDKTSGGTYNCVSYARKVGKPLRNVYA